MLTISGVNNFTGNNATYGGGVAMFNSTVLVSAESYFEGNFASNSGGAINIENSNVSLNFDKGNIIKVHLNTAVFAGGGFAVYDGQLNLVETLIFESNLAGVGGAIALYGSSEVLLNPTINANFSENCAKTFGGAFFFADSDSTSLCSVNAKPPKCFLILNIGNSSLSDASLQLNFTNNKAESGTVLYGGQLNKCQSPFYDENDCGGRINSNVQCNTTLLQTVKDLFIITQDKNTTSTISSVAHKMSVCGMKAICTSSQKNLCNGVSQSVNVSVIPGQAFNVSIEAVDQNDQHVSAMVLSEALIGGSKYEITPTIQTTSQMCMNLTYRLKVYDADHDVENGNNIMASYKLFIDSRCGSTASGISVYLTISPCPIGFTFSSSDHECVCEKVLQSFTQNCYIDKQSISRVKNNFWMSPVNGTSSAFYFHGGSCPLDYCVSAPINVTLDNPDIQCDHSHTGKLCGACKENFSLALGSLHCLSCNNAYLALIIPFALAGIALVAVLSLLRLTVAAGTLNGLIFYANIVQANHQAFFPTNSNAVYFCRVFISWINLDLGIDVCFVRGLNIYAYSWMQFLFPLYLWLLLISIIIACRYSQKISKIFGMNPIAVFNTILLISYSKILKAIIVPLSLTHLTIYPSDNVANITRERVWFYDANKRYFNDRDHLVLGIFAIFALVFLFLPYTFLLLCGHWLHTKSHWRMLSWTNKIIPFLDAYYAPYRANNQHWIGLFLLARCILFMTFAFNARGDNGLNLVVVCSVVTGLSIIKGRAVYKRFYNDFLESSFLLNLCILSLATFYVSGEEQDLVNKDTIQTIISNVSIGIAFLYFVGIVMFHICKRLQNYRSLYGNSIQVSGKLQLFSKRRMKEKKSLKETKSITNTSVRLRELLLEETNS